jgi:hypothetical protein
MTRGARDRGGGSTAAPFRDCEVQRRRLLSARVALEPWIGHEPAALGGMRDRSQWRSSAGQPLLPAEEVGSGNSHFSATRLRNSSLKLKRNVRCNRFRRCVVASGYSRTANPLSVRRQSTVERGRQFPQKRVWCWDHMSWFTGRERITFGPIVGYHDDRLSVSVRADEKQFVTVWRPRRIDLRRWRSEFFLQARDRAGRRFPRSQSRRKHTRANGHREKTPASGNPALAQRAQSYPSVLDRISLRPARPRLPAREWITVREG